MKILHKTIIMVFGICLTAIVSANEILDAWWGEAGNGLVGLGVPEDEVRRMFLNMDDIDVFAEGPGSWVYEFKQGGDVYLRRARELELNGSKEKIIQAYERANALYTAARFPQLFTDSRKDAYNLQIETYLKLLKHKGVPVEVVKIPFEGKEIIGHFHNRLDTPAPVIVWSGGTDGWKMSGLDFKQWLMDEGFAIFAMDMPGTGESQHKLDHTADRIYSRVIDYLKNERPDVDGDKIALYFGSFSGNFAVKLALVDPNVTASVNHSGGIHKTFTQYRERGMTGLPPLTTSPGMRAAATVYAFGMDVREVAGDDDKISETLDVLEKISLLNQGLLKKTPDQAPLLNIYGTADILMPIEDWHILEESGVESDGLIYEGDRHMAWEHADDHRPKMIAWLKKHLGMTN